MKKIAEQRQESRIERAIEPSLLSHWTSSTKSKGKLPCTEQNPRKGNRSVKPVQGYVKPAVRLPQ